MTNTEQLIQEMASDMNFAVVKHDLWPDDAKEIAKTLIILDYGKMPEDSVILTKEEYEELKNESAAIAKDYQEMAKFYDEKCEESEEQLKQARKETAKEFADIVYKALTDVRIWRAKYNWWLQNGECFELKNLLK